MANLEVIAEAAQARQTLGTTQEESGSDEEEDEEAEVRAHVL